MSNGDEHTLVSPLVADATEHKPVIERLPVPSGSPDGHVLADSPHNVAHLIVDVAAQSCRVRQDGWPGVRLARWQRGVINRQLWLAHVAQDKVARAGEPPEAVFIVAPELVATGVGQ